MAIYQPTYCEPFLSTEDFNSISVNNPLYLYCKVASSNFNVTGYSIKLLDENNNLVFPVAEPTALDLNQISFISDLRDVVQDAAEPSLNTGRNGTFLKIPFAVSDLNSYPTSLQRNMILASELTNGVSYKWIITLYQLEPSGNTWAIPGSVNYYDIVLSNGTIVGSTSQRIHTIPSDEILVDYFVQPVYIRGLRTTLSTSSLVSERAQQWDCDYDGNSQPIITPVGVRGRIYSYDATLGHIYPQLSVQGAWSNIINRNRWSLGASGEVANGFRVYKQSASWDDLGADQKVKSCPTKAIPWTWKYTPANVSQSYGEQTYWIKIRDQAGDSPKPFSVSPFYPFEVEWDGTNSIWKQIDYASLSQNFPIAEGDRIVLNNQPNLPASGTSNGTNYSSGPTFGVESEASKYNGIFIPYPQTPVWYLSNRTDTTTQDDENCCWCKVTIYWRRDPHADTWGELINSIVMVNPNSLGDYVAQNIQVKNDDIQDGGVINTTALKFGPEKPVVLYTHGTDGVCPEINTVGLVLYNNLSNADLGVIPPLTMFLRPLTALQNGQILKFKFGNVWCTLSSVDTLTWSAQCALSANVPVLQFRSLGNGTCELSNAYGTFDTLTVPPQNPDTGEAVVRIGKYACAGNAQLQSLQIPAQIASIGEHAFDTCTGLNTVTIVNTSSTPSVLNTIGAYAFFACRGLTSFAIPASVERLANAAFYGCSGLQSVAFATNSRLQTIETAVFKRCFSLTSLNIPDSVTQIGFQAFNGCRSVGSIRLPFLGGSSSVTATSPTQFPFGYYFGDDTYGGGGTATEQTYRLNNSVTTTTYYVPNALQEVVVAGGAILRGAFQNCGNLASIQIPSVRSIGDSAFSGCYSLAEMVVPKSVQVLYSDAFNGCSMLQTVEFATSSELSLIGTGAFRDCASLDRISLPLQMVMIDPWAFDGCQSLGSVTFDNDSATWMVYNDPDDPVETNVGVGDPSLNAQRLTDDWVSLQWERE